VIFFKVIHFDSPGGIGSTDVTLADSGEYVDILSAMLNSLGPGGNTQSLELRSEEDVKRNM